MKAKVQEKGRVSFGQAVKDFFRGYVDFSGRSTRAGYWWTVLAVAIVEAILAVGLCISIGMISSSSSNVPSAFTSFFMMALLVVWLIVLIPTISLTVRRMRDAGLSTSGIIVGFMIYAAAYTTSLSYDSAVITFITVLMWLVSLVLTVVPSNALVTSSKNRFLTSILRSK